MNKSGLTEEAAALLATHPDIKWVDCVYADLSGVVRGKRYPIDHLDKLMTSMEQMPYCPMLRQHVFLQIEHTMLKKESLRS